MIQGHCNLNQSRVEAGQRLLLIGHKVIYGDVGRWGGLTHWTSCCYLVTDGGGRVLMDKMGAAFLWYPSMTSS